MKKSTSKAKVIVADDVESGESLILHLRDDAFESFRTHPSEPFQKINDIWCLCGERIDLDENGRPIFQEAYIPTAEILKYKRL